MSGREQARSTIGDRVRQARLDAGARRSRTFTQSEVAAALGVTPATVSQWESGGTEPTLRLIPRLAEVLGVSAGWLAFGEQMQTPAPSAGTGVFEPNPATDYKLTEEEIAAARARVAEKTAARARGTAKEGKGGRKA